MSFFKKHLGRKLKFFSGGQIDLNKKDGSQGYMDLGKSQGQQADLDAAMNDYGNIEKNTRDTYTNAAKRAGTYSNTSEFNSGLNSEVQAGVRGARTEAVRRINAMRKAMGNNEEFKPEGYDQTQANVTADKLAASPDKEDAAPTSAVDSDPATAEAPDTANAASSVQNAAAKRLKALKAVQG